MSRGEGSPAKLEGIECELRLLQERFLRRTEDLLEMREQVRSLERLKRDFLMLISHELRTPLTSVLGISELLREAHYENKEDVREMADLIHGEGMRLKRFTEEALEYLQLTSGTEPVLKDVFDMQPHLATLLSDATQRYAEKDLQVCLDTPERALVKGDGRLLCGVLRRLLDNAMKFSEKKGVVAVSAGLFHTADGDGRLTITIRDEGVGISPFHLPHVFKALTLCHAHNHHSRGWGLGLAMAREVMRQHGGDLRIDSNGRGQGCRASLSLPTGLPCPGSQEDGVSQIGLISEPG